LPAVARLLRGGAGGDGTGRGDRHVAALPRLVRRAADVRLVNASPAVSPAGVRGVGQREDLRSHLPFTVNDPFPVAANGTGLRAITASASCATAGRASVDAASSGIQRTWAVPFSSFSGSGNPLPGLK